MSFSRVKLNIYYSKLRQNVETLRNSSKSEIIAMIKANAYGHGMNEIYEFLHSECNVNDFGVASIEEAVFLRKTTRDYSSNIIVFSDLGFHQYNRFQDFLDEKIIPVISSWEDLDYFVSQRSNCSIPLYIKINTGMNRLGLNTNNIDDFVQKLKDRNVKKVDHLMTHFSSSNLIIDEKSKCWKQYELFKEVKNAILESGINVENSSVSNSGAIEQGFGFSESFIRPGILLYGASVLDEAVRSKKSVETCLISSMETTIIDFFDVESNTEVGYGDLKTDAPGKVVLIGVGYGDGLPTRFSGARIKTENGIGRVIGRINMDLTAILFDRSVTFKRGDTITVWGDNGTNLTEISDDVGIIPYEILCNIGQRVKKEYYF